MGDGLLNIMRSSISSKPPASEAAAADLGSEGSLAGSQIEQGTGSPFASCAAVEAGSQQQPPQNTTCSWQSVPFPESTCCIGYGHALRKSSP